jgi:hypothetical protein
VVVPDARPPSVPRELHQQDLDQLKTGWDRMMRGVGITVQGADTDRTAFRELLRGGLADSPMLRSLFLEIVRDDARPLTIHAGRSQFAVFVDGFEFDPTRGSVAAGLHQRGHHTFDLDDFDALPRVSGSPRTNMMLRHENLVHGLREAREGLLSVETDPDKRFRAAHRTATAAENAFRREQGQAGDLGEVPAAVGDGLRWDFSEGGAVLCSETWHISDFNITSIDYSP